MMYSLITTWYSLPFNIPKKFDGQGLVEYALILVFVAIVVVAILTIFGDDLGNVYSDIICGLQDASRTTSVCP